MGEIGNRVRDWVAVDMAQPVPGVMPDFGDLPEAVEIDRQQPNLPARVRLRRPEDLLLLDCTLFNFRRRGQEWRRRDAAQPAFLVVTHQAQALGEAAYLLVDNDDQKDLNQEEDLVQPPQKAGGGDSSVLDEPIPARVPAALAGPSRVVFRMPDDAPPLAHSMAAFLEAMRTWPLALAPGARTDVDTPRPSLWRDIGLRIDRIIEHLQAGLQGHASQAAATHLIRVARQEARSMVGELEVGRAPPSARFSQVLDRSLDAEFPVQARTPRVRRRTVSRPGSPDIVVDEQAVSREIGHRLQLAESAKTIAEQLARGVQFDFGRVSPDIFAYFAVPPTPPGPRHTALELPYRLISSPLPGAGFTHALDTVSHGGRTELWHTRLGSRIESDDGVQVDDQRGRMSRMHWRGEKLRFIWSPDYPQPDKPANGANLSLDALDRHLLVRATAGFDEPPRPFNARAVHVERLMLSALGGDLEAGRSWEKHEQPGDVDIQAWTHRAFLGREAFVRVEYSGFLYPFGHPASLIKVTWRNFQWRNATPKDRRLAVLRQRFYIVVRNQVMRYPAESPVPFLGRQLPFQEIHCLVDKTPDLERPGVASPAAPGDTSYRVSTPGFYDSIGGENGWRRAFWPKRGSDFLFPFVGVDSAGSRIRFNLPAMFISDVVNTAPHLGPLRSYYNGNARLQRRTAAVQGQVVRLAPAATDAADVDYPMDDLVITGANPTNGVTQAQSEVLQQFPVLASAHVHLTALEQVTGRARVEQIIYDQDYLAHGLRQNRGDLFARVQNPSPLNFGDGAAGVGSDAAGGVATPSLEPSGLSARHGVASGSLAQFSQNLFDPTEFFPAARLLGFFKFSDVLKPVTLGHPEAPLITNENSAEGITTRFQIRQQVTNSTEPELIPSSGGSALVLKTTIFIPRDGSAPRREVEGSLSNFKLDLAGCLILKFNRIRFYQVDGRKPDIDVDLDKDHGVTFGGPLRFVNRLRDFIPANGFSDPPALDVTPSGLTVSYGLGLPDIQVGILALSNVSLGAAFTLPFTGEEPSARFNFAERHDPFNLTVSMFGGGGFLALTLGTSGVKQIEASLEFGARISIDLGVASGSVYVKGGFYFSYGEEQVIFEGYVELGGRLKVIGLITASLTFHLSLAYEVQGSKSNGGQVTNRLFGQATLIVEVSVLCFSASVSVRCSRTFKGSESDPTFEDFLPQPELWADYCNAFA